MVFYGKFVRHNDMYRQMEERREEERRRKRETIEGPL